ncbi:MAG: hypothetical protein PVI21_01745 [Candidatus Woesebacteria bacterium]|jgi:hypothetical protein
MLKKYSKGIYCFSSPVMLLTFIVEVGLAIYTLWRYKMSLLVRVSVVMLVLLAAFQAAEYMVCGGFGLSGIDWSRLGFAAITLLPPVGLHIAYIISGSTNKKLMFLSYATAVVFVTYFGFAAVPVQHGICLGNYVMFGMSGATTAFYTLYYYGWLIFGMYKSLRMSRQAKQVNKKVALRYLTVGYVAFLLPTTTVNLIDRSTLSGVPSIMCGFAVLLAFVLCGFVLPKVARLKK